MTSTDRRTPAARLADALRELRPLPRAIALVARAAGRWTALWALLLVAQGLLPVAVVYLVRELVDALFAALQAGGEGSAGRSVLLAVTIAVLMLAAEILKSAADWVRTVQAELVQDHVSELVHRQSLAVDLAFYELPEGYDRLYRARDDATYRPTALLESFGSFFQNGLTLVAMAAVVTRFGLWVPWALIVGTAPALFVVLGYGQRRHRWWREATPRHRMAAYLDWLMTSAENAAEVRLFALGDRFRSAFRAVREGLRGERLALEGERTRAEIGAGVFALAVQGAVTCWMIWRATRREIGAGDLALFYQAFQQGQSLLRAALHDLGGIYANSLFLGDLFEFLDLEPRLSDAKASPAEPARVEREVRFRDVRFTYPGASRPTLDGLDLAIPAGRVVAIVGPNGSGKSTLVKLLCRFYDPDSGSIEIDGTDLRALPLAAVRRLSSVVFQTPVHYGASAGENVAFGDVSCEHGGAAIAEAAERADARELIERLPQGYETLLGKWLEGGTELSAGEWQRIALARAFFRRAPLLVLDEPTSALDPWAEAEWMKRLRGAAAGRTAVVITHRARVAMSADLIFVMEAGRVVESGTHAELVERGGVYARLWSARGEDHETQG